MTCLAKRSPGKPQGILLALACLVLVLGCSKAIDRSELVGKYEVQHKAGLEALELRSDGTYVHRFSPLRGGETQYSSNWRLEPYGGEPKVFVDNFVSNFPEKSEAGPIGTLLGIEKKAGRIRLYVSYDLNLYYASR